MNDDETSKAQESTQDGGGGLPRRRRPCAECPWRRDVAPGQFSQARFESLTATSGSPGQEAPIGAPMFACHKSPVGSEEACAGWLAVAGHQHLGVRFAVVEGRLDPDSLSAPEGWPPLFDSFEEMSATQAAIPDEHQE